MKKFLACTCAVALTALAFAGEYKSNIPWPQPVVVKPGEGAAPPSDAIVLFGGKDLSQWEGGEKWKIEDGHAEAKGGGISTKESFGSCQLHVEFATPSEVKGSGQGRGNSGIYFFGHYELQVLDSVDNETYYDGQCAAIYKQSPPLVNASRGPGEWQVYDIAFTAPKFDDDGKVLRPAALTVFHNGVLVQNHFELRGDTSWDSPPAYHKHGAKGKISLQFHGNPVRYRNIWLRELEERPDLWATWDPSQGTKAK